VAKLMNMNLESYHETDGVNIKANHNFLSDKGYDAKTKTQKEGSNPELKANKHLECDPVLQGCQKCGNCVNTAMQKYPWNKA
jgi:hypothetical protein